jgi:hypothetical protein
LPDDIFGKRRVAISLPHRTRILRDRPRRFNSIAVLDTHANPLLLTDGWPAEPETATRT